MDNITIYRSLVKAEKLLTQYHNILCSVSGGSDSDILIDLILTANKDLQRDIKFVFYNTGIEYQATKDHIKYLESKYNIKIIKETPVKTIPTACKQHGLPFLNKRISDYIERLQSHNFDWSDESFETLYKKYPKCKAALRWWCNNFGNKSRYNIEYTKYLKEYMIENPPTFKISAKCCDYTKKKTAAHFIKENDIELNIIGVRKYEGGARNTINNCFNEKHKECPTFYPMLWYTDKDKKEYEMKCNIKHSECYTKYGLKRTGCAGCPFGLNYEKELQIIKTYEPKLYNAVCNIFADSYEYTKNFKIFRERKKQGYFD